MQKVVEGNKTEWIAVARVSGRPVQSYDDEQLAREFAKERGLRLFCIETSVVELEL